MIRSCGFEGRQARTRWGSSCSRDGTAGGTTPLEAIAWDIPHTEGESLDIGQEWCKLGRELKGAMQAKDLRTQNTVGDGIGSVCS